MSVRRIGRYEVKSEEGRGGMATVFRAYDPRFGRDVAIKVLPPQFTHDPMFRERFDREAHTIAALEHSAIVPVYDFGEEGGQPYLVMRYMPGGSLSARLEEGPLSVADCASILQRVAGALDEAHKRGIIHRDLKPGNVLFDQYGEAFLSDFGIAKLSEATAALTGSAIIGTPAYMSPEQARGDPTIDGRSDVYSLGAILFEMLTGVQPYDADTPMGIAIKHILDPVPRILEVKPDLPPAVDTVITRALSKDADDRYQTATEMASALAVVAARQPVEETPSPVAEAEPAAGPEQGILIIPPRPGGDSTHLSTATPAPPSPPAPPVPTSAGVPAPPPTAEQPRSARREERRAERRVVHINAEQRALSRRRWTLGCLLVLLIVGLMSMGGALGILRGPMAWIMEDRNEQASRPLERYELTQMLDSAEALDVTVELAAARTTLYALAEGDYAVQGEYRAHGELSVEYQVREGTGILEIRDPFGQADSPLVEGQEVDLGLSGAVPMDLVVRTGFGDSDLDLSGLNLRSLRIEGGAGTLDITLPARGDLDVEITGGAGEINVQMPGDTAGLTIRSLAVRGGLGAVNVEMPERGDFDASIASGLGSITLSVPESLPARIVVDGGIANVAMLNDQFTPQSDTQWETATYADAAERVTIQIDAGVGHVTVTD